MGSINTLIYIIMDEFIGIVLDIFQFLQDDEFFLLHLLLVENGMADEICNDLNGGGKMLIEGACVEARVFLPGESVEIATDRFQASRNGTHAEMLCPLEDHVFNKMRDA